MLKHRFALVDDVKVLEQQLLAAKDAHDELAGALAPFAGEKNDGPVKPYGIANSCEAYLEGPARIEVILDKKEAKA